MTLGLRAIARKANCQNISAFCACTFGIPPVYYSRSRVLAGGPLWSNVGADGLTMDRGTTDISRLIRAARREDPGVLPKLLESYRDYLRLLASIWLNGALKTKADPSDLVQETLLKSLQHFGDFRGQSEPELAAWLRRILARNMVDLANRFKTVMARERSLDRMLDETSLAMGNLIATSGPTPSAPAQRRELSVVLANALAKLPEDRREVIVLRNLRQLDWEAVAQTMGRSRGSVRMLWTRALKQLRPLIEDRL